MTAICVFCGSSSGTDQAYDAGARRFGAELAGRNLTLVFGGGRVGLMGAMADAALQHGGRVIGVMPRHLVDREIAHGGLTQLHIVRTMHERKAMMIELSDGFVLLPGGFGSWDEFCEAVTWRQLGLHRKPLGILNVAGYYEALLAMAERATADGFVGASLLEAVLVDDEPAALIDRLLIAAKQDALP